MRTAFALFLLTIGLSFLLFVKINSDSLIKDYKFIGVDRCKNCHSVKFRGDQYGIWKKSMHSKSMFTLTNNKAIEYAKKNNQTIPQKNENCLKCHSSTKEKNLKYFEPSFNFDDGIQCETCHNPGSEYSKYNNMLTTKLFLANGGKKGDLNDCYQCHIKDVSKSKNEKCPFQKENFDSQKAFQIIKHSLIK